MCRPCSDARVVAPSKIVGPSTEHLHTKLPKALMARLREEAEKRELTIADLITEAFAIRPVNPIILVDTAQEAEWRKRP